MVRTPCCEKMGLKKGPWTPEEDQVLISYIQTYGHQNWRALPKQAGLLRCGKSCRLRWTNYLRPDIKRGNFSMEEEETIIKLHHILGNRNVQIGLLHFLKLNFLFISLLYTHLYTCTNTHAYHGGKTHRRLLNG
ncbi:hypothetical protein SO802_012949 [Lithocarpus litseifolius]|uniref:Uncharacterized protein n=1 Tax=Lithocarpus litseifolius TaxID=425828 RepID=A0AAW2D476_9ROSI